MAKPKVFVTRVIPAAGLDRVRAACDADVWPDQMPPPRELLRQKLADCEGVLALLTDQFDAALMDACPRLRVISNFAVGFNNIDVQAATERGIAVGNTLAEAGQGRRDDHHRAHSQHSRCEVPSRT